jgi:hypothetical protein
MKKLFCLCSLVLLAMAIAGSCQRAYAQDRLAIGAQVAIQNLPQLGETPVGYGIRFTYAAYLPFLSFDAELNSFPTNSTGNLGETQVLFGLKAGLRVGRWGVFGKVRPGLAHFGGGGAPQRLTGQDFFALDLGGGVEYYFAPHVGLRWDLSDVSTSFGNSVLLAGPGGPTGVPLGTHQNFQSTIGVVVSF